MKTLRLFTIAVLAALVISTWAPFPAYAQPSTAASEDTVSLVIELKETKLAKLTVDNRTGGTLYVSLSGPRNYNFSTSKKGKTTFKDIEPGKYTITVRASSCSGSLSYKRNIKGNASLKAFVCRNK
jgi:hypothetical protein